MKNLNNPEVQEELTKAKTEFSEALREAMGAQEVSCEDLAAQLNCDPDDVFTWLQEPGSMSMDTMCKIIVLLDLFR